MSAVSGPIQCSHSSREADPGYRRATLKLLIHHRQAVPPTRGRTSWVVMRRALWGLKVMLSRGVHSLSAVNHAGAEK